MAAPEYFWTTLTRNYFRIVAVMPDFYLMQNDPAGPIKYPKDLNSSREVQRQEIVKPSASNTVEPYLRADYVLPHQDTYEELSWASP